MLPAAAAAQRRPPRSAGAHRFEITPYGGYSWTFARDVFLNVANPGRIDIEDSGMWGIALDYNLPYKPGSQVTLLYNRQDSKLQFRSLDFSEDADFAVEYWHIGGSYGVKRGNAMPFTMLTLGGTRYVSEAVGEDVWKFSIIFGAGAKLYANDRLGLKLQGRFPFSIFSGGGSVGCGPGGCYTSVGGTGVGQFDLSAGIMLLM
jgi:hypothetical protein